METDDIHALHTTHIQRRMARSYSPRNLLRGYLRTTSRFLGLRRFVGPCCRRLVGLALGGTLACAGSRTAEATSFALVSLASWREAGWLLWLLLGVAFVALVLILDRLVALYLRQYGERRRARSILQHLERADRSTARRLARAGHGCTSTLLAAALEDEDLLAAGQASTEDRHAEDLPR